MLRLITALFLLLSLCLSGFSQADGNYSTKKKKAIKAFEEGVRLFNRKMYSNSEILLIEALEVDPEFIEVYMMMGDLNYELRDYEKSAENYGKAIEIKPTFFSGNYFNHSKALYRSGDYDLAKTQITEFLSYPMRNEVVGQRAKSLSNSIDTAIALKNKPVPFELTNLGPEINTEWEDFHPSLTVDGNRLYFTRKEAIGMQAGRQVLKEDIYYSERKNGGEWITALNLGEPVNNRFLNEGAQSVSPDGRILFLTVCNKEDGVGSCDLYFSERHGGKWGTPTNLKEPLNSKKWDAQPSMSSDGKTLYFTSSRPRGKGGMDIWMSEMDSLGNWQKPVSLPFNTGGNELTSFIHTDGKTMYFGSDGLPGLGGFDIFVVKKKTDGSWGRPKNIGYPINTHKDEHGLIVEPQGTFAFMASDRSEENRTDLYSFPIHEAARPERVTYAAGKVVDDKTDRGLEAHFELIDLETFELVVQSNSDDVNGSFMVTLPTDRDYALNVTKRGYLFHSENFSLKGHSPEEHYELNVRLKKLSQGSAVVLNNIFFESGSFALLPRSKAELDKFAKYLKKSGGMRIEIGGFTDDVGSSVANQKLSEDRAKAVVTYLLGKGISESVLESKGYGESNPVADNGTEEGRAKNRRIEAKVL